MDNTLKGLIKTINLIADKKIKQGINLKALALSIKQHKKDKTTKEWKELVLDLFKRMNSQELEVLK